MLAVVVSGAAARLLPDGLPRPLVQIAFGAALGITSMLRVELDPELFFLVFVPPLLYADGWALPNDVLYTERRTILGLALGLVFLTVLGMGAFIHWLVPQLPLAVAFAIAAVISPTDPVAVSAITARTALPPRMMHLLEGESMLNDASGLVCLKIAIAAAISGAFSLPGAIGSFAWLVAGGLAAGASVAWLATAAGRLLAPRIDNESGLNILVTLLVPFAAYLGAERIGASGVLAAAASGVVMSQLERGDIDVAETRVRRRVVWDMIRYTLNGTIFVLLGEQLPRAFANAREAVASSGHASSWWLVVYVVAIVAALGALRFCWVLVSLRGTLLRASGEGHGPGDGRGRGAGRRSMRIAATMTFAGVRGALTLAGVLSLPLALADGTPLPGRELAVFIATCVILVSLVLASVALPRLAKHLELPDAPHGERARADEARVAAARAAIDAVERLQRELPPDDAGDDVVLAAASRVAEAYRTRIADLSPDAAEPDAPPRDPGPLLRRLQRAGLQAERDAIRRLRGGGTIDRETERRLLHEIDLREVGV